MSFGGHPAPSGTLRPRHPRKFAAIPKNDFGRREKKWSKRVESLPRSLCIAARIAASTMDPTEKKPIGIAIMTSGGDAQGMNGAVRAVVRRATVLGAHVHAIFEGYMGMVQGGTMIRRLQWEDVSGWLQKGGTLIGTSRCPEMRSREGRKKACWNLVCRGIDRFICIGGDGSLTGANVLRAEWPVFVQEFLKEGKIDEAQAKRHAQLLVVGMVGSIDNDFCLTDMTIGADSALHRIIEALDSIVTTASSHQRSFVVEVMGRNCGYLALSSALAAGADYVFIPENPTSGDWRDKMCRAVERGRSLGRRIGLVVVAEGAKDHEGTPITSTEIKDVMEKRLGHEPRITILGHVQRGGVPSSYDRLISTLMGVEAVNAVVETSVEGAESVVIGVRGNKIVRNPLVESVRMTQDVAKAVAEKKWDLAMKLRGGDFVRQWHTFVALTKQKTVIPPAGKALNIAVLNVGAPAPGMNSCNKAIVRLALQKGHTPLAVFNGYKGLADDEVQKFSWIDVDGWSNMGGSLLGSNRTQPDSIISEIVASIKKHDIHALLVVGGWEGYTGAISLSKNRDKYPELNIPIICIPSTISNNCPGTYQSVGCDTALNTIVEAADRVKQSAVSSRGRVFIMEIMGAKCGYLTTVAALGAGAHVVYLPENGVTLRRLVTDIERLKERFKTCRTTSLILNTDGSNPTYDTSLITKLYAEEGKGFYEVRELILGHIQQGNAPSPIDRIQAAEYAASALDFVTGHYDQEAKPALAPIGVMGNIASEYTFVPMDKIVPEMDMANRRPKHQQWIEELLPVVAGLHTSAGAVYSNPTTQYTKIATGAAGTTQPKISGDFEEVSTT